MDTQDREPNARVKALEKTCSTYATEIGRLEFTIGSLRAEVNRLQTELGRRRGVKQQARDFYRAVDDAVIARIDRRGFHKPKLNSRQSYTIDPESLRASDKKALMKAAETYDATAYFHFKPYKTGLKLQYRIVSKAYRTLRDSGVFVLKKSFRVIKRGA